MSFASLKQRLGKWLYIIPVVAVAAVLSLVLYINVAFPKTRCTAFDHLKTPEEAQIDCYACHLKITPKLAQDWFESKHGVVLVKCFVCHGQPDNKGAIPFAVTPSVDGICRRCHDPAITRMQTKFGAQAKCYDCHPFHQNSMHHDAYARTESKKTLD